MCCQTARAIARASTLLSLFALVACGGREGSSQQLTLPLEAGEANTTDASTDPCVLAQSYVFQPISSFSQMQGNDLAGPNAAYISFDGTGGTTSCEPDTPADGGLFGCQAMGSCQISGGNVETLFTQFAGCNTGYATSGELVPAGFARCGDNHAVHLRATNLTGWGMNLGIELRQDANCATVATPDASTPPTPADAAVPATVCWFDARSWTGVSFWARLGSADSATTAIVNIGDPETSSNLGSVAPFNDVLCGDPSCGTPGGSPAIPCAMSPCSSKGTCCDPFSRGVNLTSDWQLYTIPFSDMKQKGFGLAESAPNLEYVLGVKFNLSKGQLGVADYDVWVDNFAFYNPK